MKTNCWLVLGTMIAASAVAQDNTNALPPIPPPITSPTAEAAPAPSAAAPVAVETNAPAEKPARHRKHAPKRTPFVEPTVALVPGEAEVAVSNLNVRGQAGLKGEFLTHLDKGDAVMVLDQINLDKHKPYEPAQWAKIAFPTNGQVWIRAEFIDSTNGTVLPKKLNLRAGPSENYSVIGVIERGTAVNEIITKDGWTQIEPPTNAYAFVAAMYLTQEASGTVASNPEPSAETEPPAPTGAVSEPDTNAPESNTAETEENLPPPPPRVVTHEGFVRHVHSIIEPTKYELYDPKTGEDIDYLYSTTTDLDLSHYNGKHIIVTGEEGLAQRWKDTPVLTVQNIQVVE